MIDRKECEHLIGAVAVDLADTMPDPSLPTEWCDGWDAAVREHAEPLAEQLRVALVEVDRLTAVVDVGDQLTGRLLAERDALTVARNEDRTEWMTTYATMAATIEALRCGDLGPYFDGELSTERHDAFDLHLTTCERCASGLPVLMQQDAVVSQGFARRAAVVDAAVAWVRRGGTLAALTAAVNTLEDGNG